MDQMLCTETELLRLRIGKLILHKLELKIINLKLKLTKFKLKLVLLFMQILFGKM